MKNKIAKFEKVSFKQFEKDWIDAMGYTYSSAVIKEIYNSIKLPQRATTGSAGYDFFIPEKLTIATNLSYKIPTGIRCKIDEGWVLKLYPRSGLGFKYGIHLANTVGIVDEDYFYSDNEGHIFVKIMNDSTLANIIRFDRGDAFCQGIFVPFGITVDDNATQKRNGGLGSTTKEKGNNIMNTIPIWEKLTLTVQEAVDYSNIGRNKLYEIINSPECSFALRIGNRTLIKRKEFESFISQNDKL